MNTKNFLHAYGQLPYLGVYDTQNVKQLAQQFFESADFNKSLMRFIAGKKRIADLCCGKPAKISDIAKNCPDCHFIGVDINPGMAGFYRGENLDFVQADIKDIPRDLDAEGIIALHACGDLSDKIIQISAETNVPVFLVPCCYSKLNGQVQRPLSRLFSDPAMLDTYATLLRGVKRLDGSEKYQRDISELMRVLFNQDRVSRLEEAGRNAKLFKLTGMRLPHTLAIIGE